MVVSVDQTKLMRFFKEDPKLRQIIFSLKGYSINGGDREAGYQRLDMLIHHRKITVMRRVSDLGFEEAAGAASYFMGTNTFSLGSGFKPDTTYARALLAHEGAHALIDLQSLGSISRGISEAIGYTAEAMWLGLSGWDPIKAKKSTGPHPVRAKAYGIASALMAGGNGVVPNKDADDLVNLIVQHKQYDDPSPHVSDGIG
jgi:hypothetical protein